MSYRVLHQHPGGAFSEIFEVEDPASALPERLILKRLSAEMSARPEVRVAFAEEAKILRELKHPNVVTFRRCYFDDRQRVCLLMEKVSGEPLDSWGRRHASSPDQVLDLFEKVLAAVDYLHHRASPFLHLDLKPDNVLITAAPGEAQPVLIDFGIARRSRGPGLKAYTPPYGAPEQEAGGTLDCSTDVYALGQILAELLGFLTARMTTETRAQMDAVVAKATRRSRRERYTDAGEMRLAFRQARKSVAPAVPRRPLFSDLPRLPRPPRRVLTAAAGAGVAALAVAVLLLSFGDSEELRPQTETNVVVQAGGGEARKARFSDIRHRFEQALIQESPEAAAYYREARDLSDAQPEGGDDWRWMKEQLDAMSYQLGQAENGGPAAESIRIDLQQKHLTYQRP